MAKMTLDQKIEQTERLLAQYKEEKAAQALRDSIETGDTVTFDFGRGDTKKSLTGTVLGMKDDSNGRWIKVQIGDGFDAETKTIRTASITANPKAEERLKAAEETKA